MSGKYESVKSKHIYTLILINAVIAVGSVFICLYVTYKISINQNEQRLRELAQNQARIIESVSDFDMSNFTNNITSSELAWENSMQQLKNAHERYVGFGETGEFTLAKKVDNQIIFLLSHRHFDLNEPKPVDFESNLAQPMRAALSGESGVMIGLDYRGEEVVAAFEPVITHIGTLGIVAKIDLKELQTPFNMIGKYIFGGIIVVTLWITWMFFRYITPVIERNKISTEKLEKSERLLSHSQNIANIASWNLSLKDNYLESSMAMYKLFNIQKVEELNSLDDLLQKVHTEDVQRIRNAFESIQNNENFSARFRIYVPGNQVRHVQAIAQVLLNDEKKPTNLIGVIRDVTDEVLAQQNIEKQKRMLSTIFDNSSALIILLDDQANIINMNQYALNLLSYTKEEVFLKNWIELCVPTEYKEKIKEVFSDILTGQTLFSENISTIQTRYNGEHTIQWRNSIFKDEDNVYVLTVGLDITKTLQLETKYKDLYERMIDGFGIIDLDNNLIECNASLCKMLGYSYDELMQMHLEDITPKKWLDVEIQHIQELNEKGETSLYEKEYKTKDGKLVPVELRIGSIKNHNEKVIGYWALIRDISERKKIEQSLHEKDEMMITQSRQVAMGDMIAMIAHQWRQPISAITMVANNVLMSLDFEETIDNKHLKDDMEKITQQTAYLSTTIDDFRSFFNPSNAKKSVSLCSIFDDTMKIIGKSLENNNIKVITNKHDCSELELLDKELLQVLLVIMNNAKDALIQQEIKEGIITVDIGTNKEGVYIKIADNGGGISSDILPRLGEPYLTTKLEHGTGLGLYMSSIIIKKHMNGQLLWYNLNKGACIEIQLPL